MPAGLPRRTLEGMSTRLENPFAPPTSQPIEPAPPPAGPPPEPPQQDPGPPWWQRDGVVSTVLALAGVAVTLIGVVLLLVLAAQQGLLTPGVRVTGGLALSGALLLAGHRVMDRPGGRIGGIALSATGVAGLDLCILAATALYGWLPATAGLGLGLVVAAGGMAQAAARRSELLAVLVMAGAIALAPALTGGATPLLAGYLLIFAVVGAWPELACRWPRLAPVRTLPVVVVTAVAAVADPRDGMLLTVAAVLALFGLVAGVLAARRGQEHEWSLVALVASAAPAVGLGAQLDTWPMVAWSVAAAGLTALAVLGTPTTARFTRWCLVGMTAAHLLVASTLLTVQLVSPLPFLALALLVVIVDLRAPGQLRHLAAHGVLAAATAVLAASLPVQRLLTAEAATHLPRVATLTGLLTAVVAALAMLASARTVPSLVESRGFLIGLAGVQALFGVTTASVALGMRLVGGTEGFSLGQFVATATWTAAALALLHLGLRRPEHARLALSSGLALVAASLAKLFAFDLAALGGFARAAAFLVVGLALLAAGTRYARVFAERRPGSGPA